MTSARSQSVMSVIDTFIVLDIISIRMNERTEYSLGDKNDRKTLIYLFLIMRKRIIQTYKMRLYLRFIPLLCNSLANCLELTIITSPCSIADANLGISMVTILCVASLTSCSSSGVDALHESNAFRFIYVIKQKRKRGYPNGENASELSGTGLFNTASGRR